MVDIEHAVEHVEDATYFHVPSFLAPPDGHIPLPNFDQYHRLAPGETHPALRFHSDAAPLTSRAVAMLQEQSGQLEEAEKHLKTITKLVLADLKRKGIYEREEEERSEAGHRGHPSPTPSHGPPRLVSAAGVWHLRGLPRAQACPWSTSPPSCSSSSASR